MRRMTRCARIMLGIVVVDAVVCGAGWCGGFNRLDGPGPGKRMGAAIASMTSCKCAVLFGGIPCAPLRRGWRRARGRPSPPLSPGTLHQGEYRACVAMVAGDDPAVLGLEVGVIPCGGYARARIYDWQDKVDQIHEVFKSLHDGHVVDETRPDVEFYRSARELICLLPIR